MSDILIKDKEYNVKPIDVIKQLYLSRYCADAFYKISVEDKPLTEALSLIPQEHFEYIVHEVLSNTYRKELTGWAIIYNKDAKSLVYPDISNGDILEIIMNTIPELLTSYFDAIGRIST